MDPFFGNMGDGSGSQGFQWGSSGLNNMVAGHGPPTDSPFPELEGTVNPTGVVAPQVVSEQTTVKGRRKSFSTEEDLMLVYVWLNVCLDQVVSTNQTRETYWQQIADYFRANMTFESDRNTSFLSHRWRVIQESVNKFCGYYNGVVRRAPSGSTESSKVTMAM